MFTETRGGVTPSQPKSCQLVTSRSPILRTRTNLRNPIPLIHLLHNSRTPRGRGISAVGQPILAVAPRPFTVHGPRATALIGPPVPLRCNAQSARITGVTALWYRETNPLCSVSKVSRADIGSAMPERRPGRKSIPERRTRGSHSQEGLGPTF